MNKHIARMVQTVMKGAMYCLPWKTPQIIDGPTAFVKLAQTIKENNQSRPLIVTGPNIYRRGLLDGMLKAFDDENISYTVFCDVSANPTDTEVKLGLREFIKNQCDSLVLFGGGSPMDCGKAIGALYVNQNKQISQLQGLLKVGHKVPTIYAVPTTAGTGSETTIAAVITEEDTHHKASISDVKIMPSYAVLVPELTLGLPPKTTAETGMDALCHAVESFTNSTYNTDVEDQYALDAVKLIHDNILKAYNDGQDLEARYKMQLAAFYAGRSFTRGCVGYVHAIGHTLSGLYGISHGQAMAVILPHVLRKYGSAAESKLAVLADYCGMKGKSINQLADQFITWIEDTNKAMGVPATFDVVKEEDIDTMIKWAMKEGNPVYPTPEYWGYDDFKELIYSINPSVK